MPTPEKLAAIAARAAKNSAPAGGKPPAGAPPNLDDPEHVQRILEPQPLAATIGGQPVDIHPLSFKEVRRMRALMRIVFAEAAGPGPVFARISGTLVLNDKLRDQFVQIVARATYPPDATAELLGNLPAIASEIDDKADMDELATLMLVMADRNPFTSNASPK